MRKEVIQSSLITLLIVFLIGELTLSKLQNDGVDVNSRVTDPLFVDPENGDFRFKPGSPALEMGIVPIDVSEIGLRK